MDLKGDQITVRELLSNPGAKKIMERRFPAIMKSPMVAMAGDMKLSTVVSLAKGRVPDREVMAARQELERL